MDPITLAEFIAQEKQRLAAFETWWTKKMAEEPEHFIAAMNPGDWDDQYMAFDEGMME